MRKPFMLPLCCGLFLLLLLGDAAAAQPAPKTDTTAPGIELISAAGPVTMSITPASNIPANIRLEWQVLLNGEPGPKGVIPGVALTPGHTTKLRLPIQLPPGNIETWLRITGRGHSGSFQRLLLVRPWRGDAMIPAAGELTFIDSNDIFTITSPNTLIQFDKQTGWLLHYETGHVLLMGDTNGVQPVLWPAIAPRLQLFSTSTGPQLVIVRTEYTLPETASLLHLSYTINAAGTMLVNQTLEPDTSAPVPDTVRLPPLPCFGMRWLLPAGLDSIRWFGGMGAPATGRDSAPSMDGREKRYPAVRWLTLSSSSGTGLRIDADSNLMETAASPVADTGSGTPHIRLDIASPLTTTAQRPTKQYMYKVTPVLAPPIHQQNR
jgi:hypothetical protein